MVTWEEFIEQQYGRRLPKEEEARIRKLLAEGGVTFPTEKELKAGKVKAKDDVKAIVLLVIIIASAAVVGRYAKPGD